MNAQKPIPIWSRLPRPGLPSKVERCHEQPDCQSNDIVVCRVCARKRCLECGNWLCLHEVESYAMELE